jgi:hypothetical protein
MRRRIYVASSWRNLQQPEIVAALRDAGHEVYDFRNPAEGQHGFAWRQVDPDWQNWSSVGYVNNILSSPIARGGFALDKAALDWCDTCVLVLPSGRSAHLEAGYATGQGKHVVVYLPEDAALEPELMYLLCDAFVLDMHGLLLVLDKPLTPIAVMPERFLEGDVA